MERKINHATELKHIINEILSCNLEQFGEANNNPLIRTVLSKTLDINDEKPGEFYLAMSQFVQMPEKVINSLNELGSTRVPLALVLGEIEKLSCFFAKELHFAMRHAQFKQSITEDLFNCLTHAEFYLNAGADIESLDEHSANYSELIELKKILTTLLSSLDSNPELPTELHVFLSVHIFKLIEAIEAYQVTGEFSSLKYATDAIIAEILRNKDIRDISSEAEEECRTFGNVLSKLVTIIGTGNDFIQAIENVDKISQLPFLNG
ncbi:hypothetical protein ACW0FS_004499 [Vibrio vulnificus]|nr:hypothetical protein [Vibrio vulnificus]ELH3007311.1 hypothetical protein [Vibrio vulnificus]ELK8328912.1 hypothetical protein [Vibrio vulnificus]ELN6898938.1 hypothetical protein [Vibrio vulnificus]ELU0083430.1 hypothetical protein [Vibrio vulnificus]